MPCRAEPNCTILLRGVQSGLGFGLALQPAVIAELLLRAAPGDVPRDARVLAPMVEREILWRLITGEQGAAVRQLGLADSSLAHIARAVSWIRLRGTAAVAVPSLP